MSQLYRDPWAKREAWRKHPIFSHGFYFRHMFPGLTLGVGAFVVYCAWEKLGKKPLLDLGMRLGEGTGAALAAGIVKAAAATHAGMATFEQAGVSEKGS